MRSGFTSLVEGFRLGDINYFAACCRSRTFGQLYLLMREVWQEK